MYKLETFDLIKVSQGRSDIKANFDGLKSRYIHIARSICNVV
jgi:hypothetical protein